MKDIIIIGAGDFAKKNICLIRRNKVFKIIGYLNPYNCGDLFGVKYLGNDEYLEKADYKNNLNASIGIAGNMIVLNKRNRIIKLLKEKNINVPYIIDRDTFIEENVELNEGVIVFKGSFVDFNVILKSFSVINLHSLIGHDVIIGENTVISPKCAIGGGCKIGNNCFVGMHSTINPYLEISDDVIIGSGSVVTRNIIEKGVFVGNPAKKIKSNG